MQPRPTSVARPPSGSSPDTPIATTPPPGEALPLDRLPVVLAPGRRLMGYYALASLLFGPFFIFPLVALYCRFRTLRYEVDEEGITMRWGILFRREVTLTYARIQDIHLTSNVVERWLRLARIQVQTASGSAAAELTIEGLPEVERLRDFLYARMRGARHGGAASGAASAVRPAAGATRAASGVAGTSDPVTAELAAALNGIAAELRALRQALETRAVAAGGSAPERLSPLRPPSGP